ncbi:MAG: hypothetical protein ACYDAD_15905 [Acidimicrobiales bacterium]
MTHRQFEHGPWAYGGGESAAVCITNPLSNATYAGPKESRPPPERSVKERIVDHLAGWRECGTTTLICWKRDTQTLQVMAELML